MLLLDDRRLKRLKVFYKALFAGNKQRHPRAETYKGTWTYVLVKKRTDFLDRKTPVASLEN